MTKEERGQRLLRMSHASGGVGWWPLVAIDEQDRREGPLVVALTTLRNHSCDGWVKSVCDSALSKHDALDAKPEPTLLEAAKDARMVSATCITGPPDRSHVRIPLDKWEAIVAAVEREERCDGERKGK